MTHPEKIPLWWSDHDSRTVLDTLFTGLRPSDFRELIAMLRREGVDPRRRGRPWLLSLEDRKHLVTAHWLTNLTLRQVALRSALHVSCRPDHRKYLRPGGEVTVQREDAHGDRQVYVSVECECAWEPEHGLQIVFRRGCSVTKVGPFDSHLTNVSAFDRADLADVVYHRFG